MVAAVFAGFSDVYSVTAPVCGTTRAIEDTPAIQLAQQAVDSQDSMAFMISLLHHMLMLVQVHQLLQSF